jgi:hypothetical protein
MLGFALVTMLLASGAPPSVAEVRSRFGGAHVQRFEIERQLVLKIEYDASGRVLAGVPLWNGPRRASVATKLKSRRRLAASNKDSRNTPERCKPTAVLQPGEHS